MSNALLKVKVSSVWREAEDINAYELVDSEGGLLPPFGAGAHVDLHLDDGRIRQYSLCNAPGERQRYVIGVLREAAGRGGSAAIFDRARAGTMFTISAPRNLFALAPDAQRHLLLAGGIGITPMLAMVAQLEQDDADFILHYCTRAPERTAFKERLAHATAAGRVRFHHDGGDPRNGLDLAALLQEYGAGTHLYYCGPPGFMAAVKSASAHWPRNALHCEYFTPATPQLPSAVAGAVFAEALAPGSAAAGGASTPDFQVKLLRSGAVYEIPQGKSIVAVLREHGVDVETSCESGLCGTCRTRYVDGDPVHNDYVLDDEEKNEYVMICCARSNSPLLVLDR